MSKIIASSLLFLSLAAGSVAQASMSVSEVTSALMSQGLTQEQANGVVDILRTQVGGDDQRLEISGYLYASGFNGAFFVDNDNWTFNGKFIDPNTGSAVVVDGLYDGYFWNGGFKGGIGYQWIAMFIPEDMDIRSLDGAIFGRGIGIEAKAALGIELAILPGKNRAQTLLAVVPAIGVGGGLMFPKIQFKSNLPK